MSEILWAAGIVITVCVTLATVVFKWVRTLHAELDSVVRRQAIEYIPRAQVDQRFTEMNLNIHQHMSGMEGRLVDRFDRVDAELERVHVRMDKKADKP